MWVRKSCSVVRIFSFFGIQYSATWFSLFLPEELKRYIQDYREALKQEDYTDDRLEREVLKEILNVYTATFAALPAIIGDSIEKLDPAYTARRIYGKYGLQAATQLEEEFAQDHYQSYLVSMRVSVILMIVFFAVFAVLDIWCLPESKYLAWQIKGIVCLVLMATACLTFYPTVFKKYSQQIIGTALTVAGMGTIFIIALSQSEELGHNTYYAALMLITLYVYVLSGLRFSSTVWVGACLLIGYEITQIVSSWPIVNSQRKALFFFNNNFFFVTSIIIGGSACNVYERSIRTSFMIRYTISHSLKEFLNFFEYQNPDKFLKNISRMQRSPQYIEKFLLTIYTSSKGFFLPSTDMEQAITIPILPDSIPKNAVVQTFWQKFFITLQSWFQRSSEWMQTINPTFLRKEYFVYGKQILERVEQEFLQDYFQSAIKTIRIALVYAFLSYGIFSIVDFFCLPETKVVALSIRAIICITLVLILILSFQENLFEKLYQKIIAAGSSLLGIGIVSMVAFSTVSELAYVTYYTGLIQSIFGIALFTRLLFVNATFVAFTFFASYEVIALSVQDLLSSAEGLALFVNNTLFLLNACAGAAIACNFFERNARLDFLTRYTIAHKAQELLALHEHLNPTPRQLLEMINGIRHSPKRLEAFLLEIASLREKQRL
jgi:hypothetical protein